MRAALFLLLLAVFGCAAKREELRADEKWTVNVVVRGANSRTLAIDVTPDFHVPAAQEVALTNATTFDDDKAAQRRLRIDGLRDETIPLGRKPGPARGHIELKVPAVRGLGLVVEYRGHADIYHFTFPAEGAPSVEPSSGEFSRVVVH